MTKLKKYFAAIAGNVLEHYDHALYGFLIPILAPLFFPASDPIYSLLCAYALLPLGLIAKPIGAIVFGCLGDRLGRGKMVSASLIGMGLVTIGAGCLPVYEKAGWVSPFLLGIIRLLQNFFSAGETTGGALLLLEQAKEERRGWISSLFDASGIFGILLAAAAAALWGDHWRWLFWIGGLSALMGLALRRNISLPPRPKVDWMSIRHEWKAILSISAVFGYSYGNYYLITSFLNGFLPLVSKVSAQEALAINTLLLFLDLLLLPFFGWLTLKIEKERVMATALIIGIASSLPLFMLLDGASVWIAGSVRIALTMIGVCLSAPYHAWAMEKAPPEKRFAVCAIGTAIGSRLIGAPMPMISLWIYQQTHWVAGAAIPLILVALLALWAMRKEALALFGIKKPRAALNSKIS